MEEKENVFLSSSLTIEDPDILVDPEEQRAFYSFVRECVITLLLCMCVYICGYSIVKYFKKAKESGTLNNEQDAIVYKITTILCAVAVSVSLSSVILLPSSIISNEIRHMYPNTSYIRWLDTSLVKGLWNLVFLGSNVCLFLLLPFAYFFYEAEGLPGTKKGIMSRVYEAVIVLLMLALLVIGTVWVADSLTLHINSMSFYLMDIKGLVLYIPILYSCMSMIGVLITSMCTPIGFSNLFTLLGTIIVQPELHVDVDQRLESLLLEEASIKRSSSLTGSNSSLASSKTRQSLVDLYEEKKRLERHRRSSAWERHILYPLCFFSLLALTLFSLVLVFFNVLSLLLLSEHSPKGAQEHIYSLGEKSASYLGPLGALVEVILIVYMTAASLLGFFNTPLLRRLRPRPHDTSMIKIIINSIILLILSSAMPVVVQVLGITKYNLFGHFSSIAVLGNFWLLFCYNIMFISLTTLILFTRATQSIVKEVTLLVRNRITSLSIFSSSRSKMKYHAE